MKAAICIV